MYYTSQQRKMIEEKIYNNTPIDTIIATKEFSNGIEIKGYANNELMTYKFYNNGQVVRNDF